MSDQINQPHVHQPVPKMTALSTAFPMQFESDEPKRTASPRGERPCNAAPARSPHRHDAGE